MAEPLRLSDAERAPEPAARERARPDKWHELTTLIVGPERKRLDHVERTLDDPDLGLDTVSNVLPEAVRRRANDRALGEAMGPVVGEAIKASVRRDPQPIVDAIFPVIGPAIRRAIAAAFSELVQTINTTLEHSFSPRGLAWRLEAARTGRSFGEVVLSHSLLFRVEQLFVVHRETGLLVKHLLAPGVKALSPEMVAGMMTAIADFARDSFKLSRQEGLDSFALGDFNVWVEDGPAVAVAAVIRGHAPVAYREELQQAVEGIQRAHAADLDRFARDGATFEIRPGILEPCLVSQIAPTSKAGSRWRLGLIGAVLLFGLGYCAVPRIWQQRHFSQAMAALRQEPGIVVGSTGREGGRWIVSGLRDPLARDPVALIAARGVDTSSVVSHWEPYVALRPEFTLRRVQQALQAPTTALLGLRGDTVIVKGVASAAWRERALRVAPALTAIGGLDLSRVRDSLDVALESRATAIERFVVTFDRADIFPNGRGRATVDSIARALTALIASADSGQRQIMIEVRALTDAVGSRGSNAAIREGRAVEVRGMLIARGVRGGLIRTRADTSDAARAAFLTVDVRPLDPTAK